MLLILTRISRVINKFLSVSHALVDMFAHIVIDCDISTSPSDHCCHQSSVSIAIRHLACVYFSTHDYFSSVLWLEKMRKQKVVVDVWKMVFSSCSYLALAFVAYILLKLVYACFWLPNYLRKQEESPLLEQAEDVDAGGAPSEEEDKKNVWNFSAFIVFIYLNFS